MESIWIRFGDLPVGGKSGIHAGDEGKVGEEIGVSCYDAIKYDDGTIKIIMPSLKYSCCVSLSGLIDRPAFEVEGIMIGEGSDGEPLLAEARIVKKLGIIKQC